MDIVDPKTYVASRGKAVLEYLKENDMNITNNPVWSRATVGKMTKPNNNVMMEKADQVYEAFVEYFGYRKPVTGEPYNVWVQRVNNAIIDYQEKHKMNKNELFNIIGMDYNQFNGLRDGTISVKGRTLWFAFQRIKKHKYVKKERKPRTVKINGKPVRDNVSKSQPLLFSQLDYWRRNP